MNKCANKKNRRNYGIDLLRIIAMLYVVVLHTFGRGGILNEVSSGTVQYNISWFWEIWAYCAVDIFALISGYVGYTDHEKKTNYSSYIVTWFQVVFYGVVVTLIFNFINPDWVTKKDLIQMFLPVTSGLYWYFSAYTGLFVCTPLINAALRNCTEAFLKKIFIVMFIMFSVYDVLVSRFVESGYSFVWLVVLYVLGGIVKKCKLGERIKIYHTFCVVVICCLICWIWKINDVNFQFLNITLTPDTWISYTSPLVLGTALFYVIGFSKLKCSGWLQRIILLAAPSAFTVYILNNQRFIWSHVMSQRFAYLATASAMEIMIHVFGFSCLFVLLSIAIDYFRIKLFNLFHVRQLAKYIEMQGKRILQFLVRFI